MQIGAHVSIAGGFDKSIDRAVDIGANCFQTFASSPRTLKYSPIDPKIIELYLAKKEINQMGSHFFHGVYLVNLATEKPDYLKVSIDSLNFYQQTAGQIKGAGTIFHLGSHKGLGFDTVKSQIVTALESILKNTPDGVHLYLENAAGHRGIVGSDLKELGWLIGQIKSKELQSKLAVCLDTQHAFASDYDIRSNEGIDLLFQAADNAFGFDKVHVIHANDSLPELGSHKDRHANIGEGEIGESGFKLLLAHPNFKNLPFILEVPGLNKSGPRIEDVDKLRSLI